MAKRAKKKRRGAKRASSGSTRAGAGTLRGVPTSELQAELERRAQDLDRLEARRDELMQEVDSVEAEISTISAALGGRGGARRQAGRARGGARRGPGRPRKNAAAPAGRGRRAGAGRKRPRNEESLEVALAKVLKGKTMGVTEAAEAVQKAGYKTSSPNFRTIVNQALLRSDLIKKTGRGAYTAA